MKTIIDFFLSVGFIIIVSGSILAILFFAVRYMKCKHFRRYIKEGDRCIFYVDTDKEYGRITKVHPDGVEIYHYDTENIYNRTINSIYPM
jgi:hypothetical protein